MTFNILHSIYMANSKIFVPVQRLIVSVLVMFDIKVTKSRFVMDVIITLSKHAYITNVK